MSRTAIICSLIPFLLTPAFAQDLAGNFWWMPPAMRAKQRNTGPNNTGFGRRKHRS